MINNLVLGWPKPSFFTVLGGFSWYEWHGMLIHEMIWSLVGESVFLNAVLWCLFFFLGGGGWVEWWILINFWMMAWWCNLIFGDPQEACFLGWTAASLQQNSAPPPLQWEALHWSLLAQRLQLFSSWKGKFGGNSSGSKIFQGVPCRVIYIYMYMTLEKSVGFRQQWGWYFEKRWGDDATLTSPEMCWEMRCCYKPWTTLKLLLMVQKSGDHQLRLVVEIPLFTGLCVHPRWLFGISSINSST